MLGGSSWPLIESQLTADRPGEAGALLVIFPRLDEVLMGDAARFPEPLREVTGFDSALGVSLG